MHSTIGFILKSDAHKNTQDQIYPKSKKNKGNYIALKSLF